jgi:hypothetical protein
VSKGGDSRTILSRCRRGALGVALALGLLAAAWTAGGRSALAKESAYFSIGSASQSVGGDLDGLHSPYTDPDTGLVYRLGSLGAGSGLAVSGGFGFTPYLGADLTYIRTTHAVTFKDTAGDGRSTVPDSTLISYLVGARVIAPLAESLEVFGRLGLGGYQLTYHDAVFSGTTSVGSSDLTGSGAFYGVGAELILGTVGLEVSYLAQQVRFDRAQHDPSKFNLKPTLSVPISTTTVSLVYHFN